MKKLKINVYNEDGDYIKTCPSITDTLKYVNSVNNTDIKSVGGIFSAILILIFMMIMKI